MLQHQPVFLFGTPQTKTAPTTTTASKKCTIIMVHSAWLGQWQWQAVTPVLIEAGHHVITPDLPGHGSDTTSTGDITMEHYVNHLLEIIDNENQPVLLLGHSFNGITISRVAELRPDKIAGLIYLCAFLLPNGTSFFSAVKDVTDSLAVQHFYLDESQNAAYVEDHPMHQAFAHDVPEEAFIAAKEFIVPEPAQPLNYGLEVTAENFGRVEKFYIECTLDKAIPIGVQRAMYTDKVKKHYSLESAHTPNFSQPEALAEIILTIAQEAPCN